MEMAAVAEEPAQLGAGSAFLVVFLHFLHFLHLVTVT